MHPRTPTRSFIPLLALTLGLAACGLDADEPDESIGSSSAATAVSAGGLTIDVLPTESWQGGFNGVVRIIDTSFPNPITSFAITFRLNGGASVGNNSWNGTVGAADASGNRTATNPDWLQFNPLRAGGTWDVGFAGVGAFSSSTIVSVTINGQNVPINGGGDTTPPTVTLASSSTNVTTASTITLTATASDNVGVARVEFRDGTTLLGTDTSAPFTQAVALTAANNGTHSYTARAFDAAGNATTSAPPVVVTVNIGGPVDTTPPTVTLVSSATNVTTASTITLTATASDNIGVARVEFRDGTTLIGTDTSAPYTQAVAFTAANNGTHPYTARAFDAASNQTTSNPPVNVTVNIQGNPGGAVFRVNPQGRITKNGQIFPVHCGSWFGLEGRHEPSNDPTNPSGAPMEQYIGNTFWANGGSGTGRTIQQTMTEIAGMGINMIRLPLVPQTLNANDPQGRDPFLKNHASVRVANSRLALEQLIVAADQANIEVLLDMHSCSNFVGWRKGRLDARPPWADADRDNYDFKRENYSCAATGNPSTVTTTHPYNQTAWLNDLRTLAGLGQQLGVDNIIGIDIYNEPHDYTWAEWSALAGAAYTAINAVNPNTLVFVEGISATAGKQDGSPTTITEVPHGDLATNPNWGENLFQAGANPPNIPKERLVFSPHTYGPSVFVQKMFMDPAQPQCAGLEGDAAGDLDCNIVIPPALLRSGWEEHFGYLRDMGYAVVVGEFGGNLDWPAGQTSLRDRNRWSHIAPGVDATWQNTFVDYMVSKGIEGCYWSINPESGDTGGWYGHAYDPISNTAGWGEWRAFDGRKTTLLNRLWGR
jgi:endoglucanase